METPWTLMAVAVVVLAGCATPAEQAARMEREMDRTMQIYGPACERLGFKRETDQWRNCLLHLAERERYDWYNRYPYPYPYPYPMTTTCFGRPGLLHCTAF